MEVVKEKLTLARQDLLDLGLRNTLINYRTLKARGLEIVDEKPAQLYDILVAKGRAMSFLGVPEKELELGFPQEEDEEVVFEQPEDEEVDERGIALRHIDDKLQTPYTSKTLQKRLLNTYYAARTSIEEQGVNILYLALGMLTWYEEDASDLPRQAPLLLVPVELSRTSVQARFRVRHNGDDVGGNLSLQAKIKQSFGIQLPDIDTESDLDVEAYFNQVAYAIEKQKRWSVERDAVALGFFSFSKFLMFNDLGAENWAEEHLPHEHKVIQALLHTGFKENRLSLGDGASLDDHISPADVNTVVDADNSQTLAIHAINQGSHLVIQGPPGTGKSQTITNIIAEAIGAGKTVLFVSEKMAALEVVKRRLDSVHLGDACLELHSHKTNKKAFLEELRRTLDLDRPVVDDHGDQLAQLKQDRDRLNAYSKAVNTPVGDYGVTPYQAYGHLLLVTEVLQEAERPPECMVQVATWDGSTFKRRLALADEMQALLIRIGIPCKHIFWGSEARVFLPQDKRAIEGGSLKAIQQVHELARQAVRVSETLGLEAPGDLASSKACLFYARLVLSAPDLSGVLLEDEAWRTREDEIRAAIATGKVRDELRGANDDVLIPEAWDQDVLFLRQQFAAYGDKWWRFFVSDYRKAKATLTGLCRQGLPKGADKQRALIDLILDYQRLTEKWDTQKAILLRLFGSAWKKDKPDWTYVQEGADWVIGFHKAIGDETLRARLIAYLKNRKDTVLQDLADLLDAALAAYDKAMEAILETVSITGKSRTTLQARSFKDQVALFEQWLAHAEKLQEMVSFNHLADRFQEEEMGELLAIAVGWPHGHNALEPLLRETWYQAVLNRAFTERTVLAAFNTETQDQTIQRFRKLDLGLFHHARARLALKHWEGLPRHGAAGQLGLLRREFEKKRRHLPIRKLVQNSGKAIQALKPVFMMSPLSIATYLPPESLAFDLVVFDEASQVKPVDALGAIIRGKQIVVVGDSKQLPPTSFFDKMTGDDDSEEENVTGDVESILTLFVAQGAPQRMLRWHYRSRHESLIAVSNYEFYDNRLFIFPSPDTLKQELGLIYRYLPDTFYESGQRRRYNKREAIAVARAVMAHARTHPGLTLGVAAFSQSQMQAVQDQVELLRRQDPSCEVFFNAHENEPFFVKNLENVQGDERDIIYISIGYGKTEEGTLSMNFGPLNRDGGERRLNVLITRARRRCEVFTNLSAADIDLNRTQARGVVSLKRFLKYAETSIMDVPAPTGDGADSPFEEAVFDALTGHGLLLDTQVGSAGFRVDLGVRDPVQPGHYLLGIECDGASYHSAQWARDRDRLRQQVLEGLGWRIHRIWSTDWFRDPEREIRRVLEQVEAAKSNEPTPEDTSSTPQTDKRELKREKAEEDEHQPVSTRPYECATVQLNTQGLDLHKIDTFTMARAVVQVVRSESPVHFNEVTRRIIEAVGVKQVGKRIREAVLQGARFAEQRQQVKIVKDFLWLADVPPPIVRDRSNLPNSSRKIEFIAPEEVAAALIEVATMSHGISHEDIVTEACRLFGFARTTEAMLQYIEPIKKKLLRDGHLIEQGGFLVAP